MLADFMLKHCASLDMLKDAYIRVLSVLAPELKNTQNNSRKFNLYKSLVNHQVLYNRFRNDINQARDVYDSISDFFNDDAHFWLQYGSLEIEGDGGDLTLAENYLNQAESLNPKYHYIQNAKCSLFYRQSGVQNDYSIALEYKRKADELGAKLLSDSGIDDPHTHHIVCRGEYYFIIKWVDNKEERKQKLSTLRSRIIKSIKLYPRDKKLDQALAAINRAYVQLGLDVETGMLPNPDIS
jgi:tetratricopeptide (TPR) repeat protein